MKKRHDEALERLVSDFERDAPDLAANFSCSNQNTQNTQNSSESTNTSMENHNYSQDQTQNPGGSSSNPNFGMQNPNYSQEQTQNPGGSSSTSNPNFGLQNPNSGFEPCGTVIHHQPNGDKEDVMTCEEMDKIFLAGRSSPLPELP